jgi:hypothetical protein
MKRIIALIMALAGLASSALAIPAFARKYGYSCEVCHAPIPHLKAFGEEFLANGYRIPDKEPPRATVDTGDPLLLLQRELPLAIRFDGFVAYENGEPPAPDFRVPWVMKILSGGNVSKTISYYTYFLMTEGGEIAGLEDAYLIFNDVFGLPLSFSFGQFRVSDPVKPSEIRLTFEDYLIYGFRVGDSRLSLSYDRGIVLGSSLPWGTDLSLEVVNGNGIETREIFDQDKYKSFVGRAVQNLAQGKVQVGILGYTGREKAEGAINTVRYLGPDVRLRFPKIELMAEYLRRTDSNPLFAARPESFRTDAFLAEAIISPQGEKGRLFLVAVYNRIRSDQKEIEADRLALNATYLLRRNLKWLNEYSRDLDGADHRFLSGIVVGF